MLTLTQLDKRYPNGTLALSGLTLSIPEGEILAIVGGSGCGKSTLLRLIAGLDAPSRGRIALDGAPIVEPHPDVAVVFQEPRLMPWLSIEDNVGFGIRALPAAEYRDRVEQALERVGLLDRRGHWPRELSGGQAQRVALARALVRRPRVLLLDEPFSALDALTRAGLQDHLLELWAYDRPTLILVTHDIEEALVLADRVVVMQPDPGRIRLDLPLPLARPRDRLDGELLGWKTRLLTELGAAARPLPRDEAFPAVAI
ncbi:MAG: Aliphatic sulfonates import ATP-binding protein SsuB [Pseudomonadota bacterium]|jgi:sulfonate transport system ATP-binding protein